MSGGPDKQLTIHVCFSNHDHDRTYTENVAEFLDQQNVRYSLIELAEAGQRPQLQQCLDEPGAVLGYNSQLDHSWIGAVSFVAAAAGRGIPVIQWILDHPSSRWHEFNNSTATNSCFLLNTLSEEAYFHRFCHRNSRTAIMGGVGPSRRSRIRQLSQSTFFDRPINCMIPLGLTRLDRSMEGISGAVADLDRPLAEAVTAAVASGRCDLIQPLETHLLSALEHSNLILDDARFNFCFRLVQDSVQSFRRILIFETARNYPVLIQSDETAARIVQGSAASFSANVDMPSTLAAMPSCRAVLSVSPLVDMIHDRTANALNGGCVAIVEDNLVHRAVFRHGLNALLFRYDDDSLRDCLDIVCNQPDRAFSIAQAGMKLRDDPRLRFGYFHNIISIAGRQAAALGCLANT